MVIASLSQTTWAANEPSAAALTDTASVSASEPHSVVFGDGVVAMAPIPDKPAHGRKTAPADETAMASFSVIDQNPSLTGTPDTRRSVVIKNGKVMMAPVSDDDDEREPVSIGAVPRSELGCLAKAIYFEARGESARGQQAVAQVILARKRAPGRPKTICGVVYEGSNLDTGCQFSFTCDGIADVVRDQGAWARAKRIAAQAINGKFKRVARGATYFHARYVRPNWASHMVRVATIGTHVFYRP